VTWTALRQHRAELLSLGATLAVIGLFLVITGHVINTWFTDNGVAGCLVATPPVTCTGVVGDFTSTFGTLVVIVTLFAILPILAGIFIGAPMLAREFERGTDGLAWTQSVTRWRWLTVKLIGMVVVGLLAAVIFTVMLTWWRGPFDQVGSRLADGFDIEGVVEIGYFLFALSLGVLVGIVVRRTLPAMALTLVVFIAVRGPVEFILRPRYASPITVTAAPGANISIPSDAWRLTGQFIDGSGNTVTRGQIAQLCGGGGFERGQPLASACLTSHGIVRQTLYQPADRFWSFQLIELGIFLTLTVVCLVAVVAWMRRRA
jgi:hypothetical protein